MNALVPVYATPLVATPQATSDEGMVEVWLDSFRSAGTRRGYALDVRAFRAWLGGKGLARVTVRDIQMFAATLDHLAPATIARRLSAIKSLFAMGHRLGYLAFDVGGPVLLPQIKDTLAERIITEEDVQRLLWLERRPRNAALLRLLYGAGLRISEACGLTWRDLTPRDAAGQLNVFGKGGRTRVILLPKPLWDRISALHGEGGSDDAVFRSRQGGAINRSQVHRIVKAAAARAGLPPAVSAHFLRHAHASHALDRGCPVHVLQTSLGHRSLTTTTRYTHAKPGDSSARYLAV